MLKAKKDFLDDHFRRIHRSFYKLNKESNKLIEGFNGAFPSIVLIILFPRLLLYLDMCPLTPFPLLS